MLPIIGFYGAMLVWGRVSIWRLTNFANSIGFRGDEKNELNLTQETRGFFLGRSFTQKPSSQIVTVAKLRQMMSPQRQFLGISPCIEIQLVNNSVMNKKWIVLFWRDPFFSEWLNCQLPWFEALHFRVWFFVSRTVPQKIQWFLFVSYKNSTFPENLEASSLWDDFHTPGYSMRPFDLSVRGYFNFLKRWLDLKKVTGNWQVPGDSRSLNYPNKKVTKTCQLN